MERVPRGAGSAQQEAVEALLRQRRLLLATPPGGEAGLAYEPAAARLPGTTLVVSSRSEWIRRRRSRLRARGVETVSLPRRVSRAALEARLEAAAQARNAVVYVAPERLCAPGVAERLRRLRLPLVAVEEAHRASRAAPGFRPAYAAAAARACALGAERLLLVSGSAAPDVRRELGVRFGLGPAPPVRVRGFARPELALRAREVCGRRGCDQAVDLALADGIGAPGAARGGAIVHAGTARRAEEEAWRLGSLGWRVAAYHTRLPLRLRRRVAGAFRAGVLEVLVVAGAGPGELDRDDVRVAVHRGPPGSLEAWCAEVAETGRDGLPAIALLLFSPGELTLRRAQLERSAVGGAAGRDATERRWSRFLLLMRWAETSSCRHRALARHFGDELAPGGCGRCDVCQAPETAGARAGAPDDPPAREALAAIARLDGRFGMRAAVRLLGGRPDPRLRGAGLDRTSPYGSLKRHDEARLRRLVRRCVTSGWVDLRGGDRPVVVLTRAGRERVAP